MGISGQEYWSGLPCPPPEDLSDQGLTLISYVSEFADGFSTTSATFKAPLLSYHILYNIFLLYIEINISSECNKC